MDRSPERLLDALLPSWDVAERQVRVVHAPPDAVWRALPPAVAAQAEAAGG